MAPPAEIVTTVPYQNVRAAVRLFAEKADSIVVTTLPQKYGTNETEIQELKEALAMARAQVKDAQQDRDGALLEIGDLKKCLEESRSMVHGSDYAGKEETVLCTDERHTAVEAALKLAKQEQALAMDELQALKREMHELKQKFHGAVREKESAMRQAEEAVLSAEYNAKRADELSNEISGTKESLLLVKMACVEANKEREALLAATKVSESERAHTQSTGQVLDGSHQDSNKLEHKLKEFRAEVSKEELRVVRHNLIAAQEALANIDRLKSGCQSPVSDATICIELKAAKAELSKAIDNDTLIESTVKELQDQLREVRKELDSTVAELVGVRSREAHTVMVLKSELEKTKEELKGVALCNEALVGLSQKLEKMAVLEEDGFQQAEDAKTVKVHNEARAELHALLKEEAAAARQKAGQFAERCQEMPYKTNADNYMTSMKIESPRLISAFDGESEVVSWRRGSDNEEQKKKKKLALPLFSGFLSRSKRGSRKETSST